MTVPDWLDSTMRRSIVSIFEQNKVDAPVYLAREVDPTEVCFVIGPVAELPQVTLTKELIGLLGRKVAVTTWSDSWEKVGLVRIDVAR
jgi:hypothetical protein